MYKSPIEIIQSDIQMKTEECILKAVQKIGVNIDKDELIKAIMYDRKQYEKGYEDGIADAQRWIPCGEGLPQTNVNVLVTTVWGFVTVGARINRDHELWFLHDNIPATDDDVVAWMPLPKSYRKDGDHAEGSIQKERS